MSRTCATCSAFDRAHLVHHAVVDGGQRHPAAARCKAAPPPWPVVLETDWCRAWALRPGAMTTLHQDDGP
jgi:hypothetical protein